MLKTATHMKQFVGGRRDNEADFHGGGIRELFPLVLEQLLIHHLAIFRRHRILGEKQKLRFVGVVHIEEIRVDLPAALVLGEVEGVECVVQKRVIAIEHDRTINLRLIH